MNPIRQGKFVQMDSAIPVRLFGMRRFIASLVLVAGCASDAAQVVPWPVDSATAIGDAVQPSCAKCSVRLHALATLGSQSDTVLLPDIPVVERDALGRFYVAVASASGHPMLMYEPDGRFSRMVGRPGTGPGEFNTIRGISVARDSLFVLHDNRISVLDSTGRLGRSFRFGSPVAATSPSLVAVVPHGVVLSAHRRARGPDTVGRPLQRYDNHGTFVGSFGPLGVFGEYSRQRGQLYGKREAVSLRDGSYWLADLGYRFERIDSLGRVTNVIAMRTPEEWNLLTPLSPQDLEPPPSTGTRKARPPVAGDAREIRPRAQPRVFRHSFGMLDDTLMIVLIRVPVPDWENVEGRVDLAKSDSTHTVLYPGYVERLFDTVLDVLDVKNAVLLARERVGGLFTVSSDGMLYRSSTTRAGLIQVEIFSLEFGRWCLPIGSSRHASDAVTRACVGGGRQLGEGQLVWEVSRGGRAPSSYRAPRARFARLCSRSAGQRGGPSA